MKTSVLIVTERGPEVGLGHFSRCLRILSQLSSKDNFSVRMIVVAESEAIISGDSVVATDLVRLKELMVEWVLETERPKIVVLDAKSCKLMSAILEFRDQHRATVKICVIDRWEFPSAHIDFWFIPSFYNRFPAGKEPACDWCFGWDCVLLPPHRQALDVPKEKSVFVNFGSSAHYTVNSQILEEIVKVVPRDWRIDLILGEYTKVEVPNYNANIVAHRGLTDLRELQDKSLVGFSIYGVTLFELFQSGVASVTFSNYSKLEEDEVDKLVLSRLTMVAKNPGEVGLNVGTLIRDNALRELVASRARWTVRNSGFETLSKVLRGL